MVPRRAGAARQEREEALAAEARAMAPRMRARPPLAAPLAGAAGWALGAAAAALPGRYGAAITSAPPAAPGEAPVCAVFSGQPLRQCAETQVARASLEASFTVVLW
jgi:demethoxyubiquinone hydroxylase (CLK1/Coq7/Cat5 family)